MESVQNGGGQESRISRIVTTEKVLKRRGDGARGMGRRYEMVAHVLNEYTLVRFLERETSSE